MYKGVTKKYKSYPQRLFPITKVAYIHLEKALTLKGQGHLWQLI